MEAGLSRLVSTVARDPRRNGVVVSPRARAAVGPPASLAGPPVCILLFCASCSLDTGVSGASGAVGDDGGAGADRPVMVDCTRPGPELCDRADNDCDPATADGADEPMLGAPCDSEADTDLCAEGTLQCVAGALVCDDFTDNTHETCNGEDDDCDGNVDEDPVDGTPAWPDGDGDGYGPGAATTHVCDPLPEGLATMGGDCDDGDPDVHPGATETCDGRDEDCSGIADDGAGCACTADTYGGHVYYFCTNDLQSWIGARDSCRGIGAELVTLDTLDENGHVMSVATATLSGPWWIGLNDRSREGTWVWADGSALGAFASWSAGEPNNGGGCWLCEENCVEASGSVGLWNDQACNVDRPFICEDASP